MILQILTGCASAIGEAYPDAPCWVDRIPQNLTPPCFFIEAVAPREQAEHDRRFRLTCPVRVHYFPANTLALREDCERVAFRLYDALEFIRVGDVTTRGYESSHKITQDGILMLDVTYRVFYLRTHIDSDMKALDLRLTPREP